MKIEWNEIEPGTYEARAGDWLLEVGRDDDGLPWTLLVGLLPDRHGGESAHRFMYRRTVTGSLDEAQRAAVALAVEKCAPFAATARAEAALAEREACAQWFEDRAASYERRATLVAGNPASFGGAAVAEDVVESLTTAGAQARLDARTIRERSKPEPQPEQEQLFDDAARSF